MDALVRWLRCATGEIFIPAADQMSSSEMADFIGTSSSLLDCRKDDNQLIGAPTT